MLSTSYCTLPSSVSFVTFCTVALGHAFLKAASTAGGILVAAGAAAAGLVWAAGLAGGVFDACAPTRAEIDPTSRVAAIVTTVVRIMFIRPHWTTRP